MYHVGIQYFIPVDVLIFKVHQILMAAGDTFRAAASDQLEIWAERTGCEIVVAETEKAKASSGANRNEFYFQLCC